MKTDSDDTGMSSQRVKEDVRKVFIEGTENPFFLSGNADDIRVGGAGRNKFPNRSYVKTFVL